MKKDKNELFRAISDAQKASERIVGNYEKKYGLLQKEKKIGKEALHVKKVRSRKGKSR